MQLISEDYRKLNSDKHASSKHYGTSGRHYLADIIQVLKINKTQDLLDYGCGKSTLANNLPFRIKQYDPAIRKYQNLPDPADIVVCTDVLEHIEPDLIDNVMQHISSLTRKMAFLVAALVPANKTLADGRNAHILLKDAEWWKLKVSEYFEVLTVDEIDEGAGVKFLVKPKEKVIINA